MENRFKVKISRMFRSSFGTCRSRNVSDIIEKPVFAPQNHKNFYPIQPVSTKARPFPSICRPKCLETAQAVDHDCIVAAPPRDPCPRRKVSEKYSPFFCSADIHGRMCPPASPISPWNPCDERQHFGFYEKKNDRSAKKTNNKRNSSSRKKRSKKRPETSMLFSSSSFDSTTYNYGGGWWSNSEEDETDTLFSSRSLSSDSSGSRRRQPRKKTCDARRKRPAANKGSEMGVLPLIEGGKVRDSFAVVKRSSDPYNDFRTSMVEMIVEKQIFAAKDLEQLLQCFLSLNSRQHHRIIVEVFTEIYEALFSNWS